MNPIQRVGGLPSSVCQGALAAAPHETSNLARGIASHGVKETLNSAKVRNVMLQLCDS